MMDQINFNTFDMRDPDGAKALIRAYLSKLGFDALTFQVQENHKAEALLQEAIDMIYGAWAEGYKAGEQRTIDRYDPDPYDEL